MCEPLARTTRAWTAFTDAHRDRTSADLVSELRALNPALTRQSDGRPPSSV
jgi:hypothetical protein